MSMKHLFLAIFFLFSIPAQASENFVNLYNGLLSDYVKSGQKANVKANLVNYQAWGKDARHAKALQALQAKAVPAARGEKLAYWMNAYNFLTIDLITREKESDSIKNLGSVLKNPWKKHKWTLHGKEYTLDGIEHKILRKMGEPRIHMAINCASLSCPDLRAEAYTSSKLEAQLKEQTNLLLKDTTKGMMLTKKGVKLSKIFDWFDDDFGSEKELIAFLRAYDSRIATDAEVDGYFSYNWKLNSQ